jgi:hypothetical protein
MAAKGKPGRKQKGSSRKKTGRPSKLPQVQVQIIAAVKAGNYRSTAAALAGIQGRTLAEWIRRGTAGDPEFSHFSHLLKKAEAAGEAADLARIKRASIRSWTAAAWRLERKYPERWGRKDRLVAEVEHHGTGLRIEWTPRTAAEIATTAGVELFGALKEKYGGAVN